MKNFHWNIPTLPLAREKVLIRGMRGDVEAFRRIVEHYERFAYALAFRITCNHNEARNVTRESFVRLWRYREDYRARYPFRVWLGRIIVRVASSRLRRPTAWKKIYSNSWHGEQHPQMPKGDIVPRRDINSGLGRSIEAIAEYLPLKQRLVFVLRDLQNFEMDEMRKILGISRSAVRQELTHTRRQIRQHLQLTISNERSHAV